MTVKETIEKLSQFPPSVQVIIHMHKGKGEYEVGMMTSVRMDREKVLEGIVDVFCESFTKEEER